MSIALRMPATPTSSPSVMKKVWPTSRSYSKRSVCSHALLYSGSAPSPTPPSPAAFASATPWKRTEWIMPWPSNQWWRLWKPSSGTGFGPLRR
eukprot:6285315-Prymnesium_polylepis.2